MGAVQSSRSTRVIKAAVVTTTSNYVQNLQKIGQVNVQSPSQFTHVIRNSRALEESHGVDAYRLSQLFDARKNARTTTNNPLEDQLVQRLATRYNSPSIGRENTIILNDGDRRLYREAIWVDAAQSSK